jgi:mRNA interferase MazF
LKVYHTQRKEVEIRLAGDATIRRGDVFYTDLSPIVGSEQGGERPVVVISNDIGNKKSPIVIVAAISSSRAFAKLPTQVQIEKGQHDFSKDSVVFCEQIRTIDKCRLQNKKTSLSRSLMANIDQALIVSFDLNHDYYELKTAYRKGDIYLADLSGGIGSEHCGMSRVVVVQNNIGNHAGPTLLIAPTKQGKRRMPTHLAIPKETYHFPQRSVILHEQLRTIDKKRIIKRITTLEETMIRKQNHAIRVSLGLPT